MASRFSYVRTTATIAVEQADMAQMSSLLFPFIDRILSDPTTSVDITVKLPLEKCRSTLNDLLLTPGSPVAGAVGPRRFILRRRADPLNLARPCLWGTFTSQGTVTHIHGTFTVHPNVILAVKLCLGVAVVLLLGLALALAAAWTAGPQRVAFDRASLPRHALSAFSLACLGIIPLLLANAAANAASHHKSFLTTFIETAFEDSRIAVDE